MTSEDSYGGSILYTATFIEMFCLTLKFCGVRDVLTEKNPASTIWLKSSEMLEFTPLLSCVLAIAFLLLMFVDWHSMGIVNAKITPGIFS